jgi:hypothetical protein
LSALLGVGWWFFVKFGGDNSPKTTAASHAQPMPATSANVPEQASGETTGAKLLLPAATAPLSAEDTAAIERLLAQVEIVCTQAEIQSSQWLEPTENEDLRDEHVLVKALTTEQLDPVYSALTEAGKAFPPDSAADVAFRKRADEFVADLSRYPMRLATKETKKSDGTVSYGMGFFGDKSKLTKGDDGSFTISGGSAMFNRRPNERAMKYFFPEAPQTQ